MNEHLEVADLSAQNAIRAWRHRGSGLVFCDSAARFGIFQPTWITSFARARLTRGRFLRQMESRKPTSRGYESLKRGGRYWTDFAVAGKRYRKCLGTTNLQIAKRRERELFEKAIIDVPEGVTSQPRRSFGFAGLAAFRQAVDSIRAERWPSG